MSDEPEIYLRSEDGKTTRIRLNLVVPNAVALKIVELINAPNSSESGNVEPKLRLVRNDDSPED